MIIFVHMFKAPRPQQRLQHSSPVKPCPQLTGAWTIEGMIPFTNNPVWEWRNHNYKTVKNEKQKYVQTRGKKTWTYSAIYIYIY